MALLLLCATVSSTQPRTSRAALFQESQQNQTTSQEKPAQDKPTDSKKDSKPSDPTTTRLRIHVTATDDKPVGNASVYVRFPVAGGIFHKDKLSELNLKTNEDGSVKVPDIPRGKILIQVVAKGWKTYGKWYEIDSEAMTVEIKLEPPAHWY
ncbi:MAG: carboxypeptidase-like regulatory domain-containing protein [Candidatus Acidiferrales bacterium]